MTSGCKSLLASVVFLAATYSNAQNLMNKIYVTPSLGAINRGDFNEDGIPDVVFLTSDGVKVGMSNSKGQLTFLSSSVNTQGSDGDEAVAKFTSSGHLDVAVLHSFVGENAPPN